MAKERHLWGNIIFEIYLFYIFYFVKLIFNKIE